MVKRAKDKISMPMSSAGLVRYMEEEGRGAKFKPEHVLFAAGAVIVFSALLRAGLI